MSGLLGLTAFNPLRVFEHVKFEEEGEELYGGQGRDGARELECPFGLRLKAIHVQHPHQCTRPYCIHCAATASTIYLEVAERNSLNNL